MLVDMANEQQSFGHDIAIIVINDSLDAGYSQQDQQKYHDCTG